MEEELQMLQLAEEQLQSPVKQLQVAQEQVVDEAQSLKSQLFIEQEARTALQKQVIYIFTCIHYLISLHKMLYMLMLGSNNILF